MNTASLSSRQTETAQPSAARAETPGLSFTRHFTTPGIDPYTQVKWELRDAVIQDWKGNLIFEQKNVESPTDWSMTATNIVASKYLHGLVGTPERENGVRALITRVAESIRDWGIQAATSPPKQTPTPFTPSSCTCCSTRKSPSIRPSGST